MKLFAYALGVAGFSILIFGVSWQTALGVFLAMWGNNLAHALLDD